MADSKRQKIVDAIVTRLKLINGAGSYTTNVANRVKDSETNWAQDQDTLPAISVFDGDAIAHPTSPANYRSTVHEMSVLIKFFAEQGSTAANARNGIKDINTAIRQDDKWTVAGTPLAMQTREVVSRVQRNQDSFEVEGAEVEIAVHFITGKFNAEV
jgi:hypothetical protein